MLMQELREVSQVFAVRYDGTGRQSALMLHVAQETSDVGVHSASAYDISTGTDTSKAVASISFSSIQAAKSAAARSARIFRLSLFPLTLRSNGSTSPQFEFIGWKLEGSLSFR